MSANRGPSLVEPEAGLARAFDVGKPSEPEHHGADECKGTQRGDHENDLERPHNEELGPEPPKESTEARGR